MRSLSTYLNESIGRFTVAGTVSDKLLIFDVDDTLIHTSANILIMKNGKHINTISNTQFNTYKLKPGESFDFREFDDAELLSKETFTKYWDTLKREYNKGTHISILTARNDIDMIRNFFLTNGIDIKMELVFAVNDPRLNLFGSVAEKKAVIIKRLSKLGYKTLVFFDDSEDNLHAAKSLENKFDIKIHTIKV